MGIGLALRDLNIMILNWKCVSVKFSQLESRSSPSPNLSENEYVVHLIYNKVSTSAFLFCIGEFLDEQDKEVIVEWKQNPSFSFSHGNTYFI